MTTTIPATAASTCALGPSSFGNQGWDEKDERRIQGILHENIPQRELATRPGAGRTQFTYVEGWRVIATANSIFGFDGWSSSVVTLNCDFADEAQGKVKVGVTAVVRVTLKNGSYHEDCGFGQGEGRGKGDAIEKAKKEAVTDGLKRTLRIFGNRLGNSVYNKDYLDEASNSAPRPRPGERKVAVPAPSFDQLRHEAGAPVPAPAPASASSSPVPVALRQPASAPAASLPGVRVSPPVTPISVARPVVIAQCVKPEREQQAVVAMVASHHDFDSSPTRVEVKQQQPRGSPISAEPPPQLTIDTALLADLQYDEEDLVRLGVHGEPPNKKAKQQ